MNVYPQITQMYADENWPAGRAKSYEVGQVRNVIVRYKLAELEDDN